MFKAALAVAAMFTLGACSSARPARTAPATAANPTAGWEDLITHSEIARAARSGASSAYDVVEAFRSGWVCPGCQVPVFVDGVEVTGVYGEKALSQISAANIDTIRRLSPSQALLRFGTHRAVILVKTLG